MATLAIRRRAGRFWHGYTRMRTAIFFLAAVVVIVIIGSFVPQQDTSVQGKVDGFLLDHQNLNALARHLGLPLTQVFVSPLFLGLLASLYIALGACVLRRARALVSRSLHGYPRTPQYWGEWGSWLFHASFFLLLVAVLYGKATGFEGLVAITEGQRVTEARGNYDELREGLLSSGHSGYQVQLNSFKATYAANGAPSDFVSNVTVYDNGSPVQTKDIRVNDFLGYKDVDFYQQDYGWAPRLVVRNPAGQVVFDNAVQLFGEDKSQEFGVLKVPDFGYSIGSVPEQLGANLTIYPDARSTTRLNADGSVSAEPQAGPGGQEARNPVLLANLWVGDLGLNTGTPQNVNALDTTRMQPYFADRRAVPIGLGQKVQLPLVGSDCTDPLKAGCFTLEFSELKQYSLFHVKKDNGVPFVYVTFGLIMTGLLTKLYLRPLLEARARRRRIATEPDYAWLASIAGESAEETSVSVGGR